jgi:hypothetical protein
MNDLNVIQLAAKDSLVRQYGSTLLALTAERWTEMVNDRMCAFLDLTEERQWEIIESYRRPS